MSLFTSLLKVNRSGSPGTNASLGLGLVGSCFDLCQKKQLLSSLLLKGLTIAAVMCMFMFVPCLELLESRFGTRFFVR